MAIAIVKTVHKIKRPSWGENLRRQVGIAGVSCFVMMVFILGWVLRRWPQSQIVFISARIDNVTSARPSIMLLGDSLTEFGGYNGGWGFLLQASCNASIRILNRGRKGFNTNMTIEKVLPNVLTELKLTQSPIAVTLWLGANDAALPEGFAGFQHIPLETYKTNLAYLITKLRQAIPVANIILISPPFVDDDTRRARQVARGKASDPIDRTNEETGKYAAACREIANSMVANGVAFLDVYKHFMDAYPASSDRSKLLYDGLHFNARGNREVFDLVKQQIQILRPSSLAECNSAIDP